MLKILEDANAEVQKNLEKAQEVQKWQFDKSAYPQGTFEEGDLVMIQVPPKPGMNIKFCVTWAGPYEIVNNGIRS